MSFRNRSSRWLCLGVLVAATYGSGALTAAAPPQTASASEGFPIVYDDLDAFASAIAAIEAGAEPKAAIAAYLAAASPGMQIFVSRFGVNVDSMAARLARYPRYYRHLASLRPQVEAREPELRKAIAALQASAPEGSRPVPVYYLVANMTAGGNPGIVETPQGRRPAIGVAIDLLAMSPRVDMSEFPNGPVGLGLEDIPYTTVHEMTHVFQAQLQGMENYRSIYTVRALGTHLAFAIREGCADFLTFRATGWTAGERRDYVTANEAALWSQFKAVLHEPQDLTTGWFGPRLATRGWPMQVGYGVGMAICQTYYESAADKEVALRTLYGAHLPSHFDAIVAPYAARMDARAAKAPASANAERLTLREGAHRRAR